MFGKLPFARITLQLGNPACKHRTGSSDVHGRVVGLQVLAERRIDALKSTTEPKP